MDYFLRYLDLIDGRMSAMILLILVICRVFWVCIVPAKGYSVLCWPIIVLMLCVCKFRQNPCFRWQWVLSVWNQVLYPVLIV